MDHKIAHWIHPLLKTRNESIYTILRISLGIVLLAHGLQKSLGWFGGYGYTGTMAYFTDTMGLPWVVAFLVILLETLGAILLLFGVGTRLIAISITFLAIGIIVTSHWEFGFFMNWGGNQNGKGFEYFVLWLAISISLIISGGGSMSFDRYLYLYLGIETEL